MKRRRRTAGEPTATAPADSPREAPSDDDVSHLLDAARSARFNAYGPYSGRRSGAAVLTSSGRVFGGCNVEFHRTGSSLDADQVALANAVTAGERAIVAVAVASGRVSGTTIDLFREFTTRLWVYEIDDEGGAERVHVHVLSLGSLFEQAGDPDRVRPLSIRFASAFVSYSHRDEAFVAALVDRLRGDDVPVWCAAQDMRPDAELGRQIGDAIVVFDRMLLVVSPSSLSSAWVRRELDLARAKEDQVRRLVVIPISLLPGATVGDVQGALAEIDPEFAGSITSRYLADFSRWDDEAAFEVEYGKLLEALRASFV